MIPKDKITKQHVLDAISEIDRAGVPDNREAKGFDLIYEGKAYPPKYVLSLAVKYTIGTELPPNEFTGGEPTNSVLRAFGFEVKPRPQQSIRDSLEKVMEQYVTARTREPFGKESQMWNLFVELRRSVRRLDPIQENPHIKIDSSVAGELGEGTMARFPR